MLPDPTVPLSAEAERLARMEGAIHELNVQIARLAILLGVSLESREQVALALQHTPAVAQERRGSSGSYRGPERRSAHRREELRALLVMRYELEKNYVEELGPEVTQQLMLRNEQALTRLGFRRGADGVDLDLLASPD